MGDLPVAALRLDAGTELGLSELGITRIEHLLNLPRASLAARFDPLLVRRVQQALGEVPEHIDPVRPVPPVRADLVFDGPTDHWESVEAAAKEVLGRLVAELVRRERGVRRLDAEFLRPRVAPVYFQINLSRPSAACKHLWSLLRSRLEKVDLGEGIEGVSLVASRTARLHHEQAASRALGAPRSVPRRPRGVSLSIRSSRSSGLTTSYASSRSRRTFPSDARRERSVMELTPRGPVAAITTADRPTILFPRPERAEVMALTPDGPILSVGWRSERWNVVSCSARPERIGPEWWRWEPPENSEASKSGVTARASRTRRAGPLPPLDRDYFVVQTQDGRHLWMCRHTGTSRWFVHGEWT